jgi:hypothetical protein
MKRILLNAALETSPTVCALHPKRPTIFTSPDFIHAKWNETNSRVTIASNTRKPLREQIPQRWACASPAINPAITWTRAVLMVAGFSALWVRLSLHRWAAMRRERVGWPRMSVCSALGQRVLRSSRWRTTICQVLWRGSRRSE